MRPRIRPRIRDEAWPGGARRSKTRSLARRSNTNTSKTRSLARLRRRSQQHEYEQDTTPGQEEPGGARGELGGEPGGARRSQEEPGESQEEPARGARGEPGGARRNQGEPGAARGEGLLKLWGGFLAAAFVAPRGSQEEPGGARRSQKEPGGARGSQGEPGGARRSQGRGPLRISGGRFSGPQKALKGPLSGPLPQARAVAPLRLAALDAGLVALWPYGLVALCGHLEKSTVVSQRQVAFRQVHLKLV